MGKFRRISEVKENDEKYLKKSLTNTVANCNYNKQFVSAEHIYPQCLLNIKQSNDMHNIIKTINTLNANRSNYKFHEDYDIKNKWYKVEKINGLSLNEYYFLLINQESFFQFFQS